MQIELNSLERRMIITALTMKKGCFTDKIREPQTPAAWRKTRTGLIMKLGKDELLHEEVRDSLGVKRKAVVPN